ncbi:outer membrane protein assembly factor BamC [Aggregatibacter actinomycetemcomitans]|uniref:outer membrane protein assembly factor BamC n=1 Tax=Aggregatibacter actinomycetemcomitans TaxID=714 RepID=UPI00022AD5BB|nr:outer membrane protein assembly factor BamC [Aggregatibacter actinomycetemcomitans]KOE70632.1 outer membrane protein assembly protein BamC [Aggregatibacter actinomycetemcomitans serotype f str. D18P1]KYK86934.1 NlpB protein [Aggregatibacter actinomycetemcomitans serotype f str. SC29R]MBN6061209.1 outer membrane protein assembly factor BamC [Aggregatibacter actinomycetemcomitans]OZV18864.1 outer membrane protein assembly factor BamC [Aggregatibacter actinomycetemcomitans]UEL53418.1 outer mem
MKKWLLTVAIVTALSACSTGNESKQQAGDTYQKSNSELPYFTPLASGGVNLPAQSAEYQLPPVKISRTDGVDIRPPSLPLAIISNSVTQFDGERALIAYTPDKQSVYNLTQVERLLKEQDISYTVEGNKLLTDWANTGRADDLENTKIRYQIEEVNAQHASALVISVLQMKRDDTIFTPNFTDKQRYASDRLNQLVGELNSAYQKQQQALNGATSSPIQSAIATDANGRTALVLATSFDNAWQRLGSALPKLGFEIQEETGSRGIRELEYKPLSQEEWRRVGMQLPDLGKGTYQMQLAAVGKQSAVIISDENKTALSGEQAQLIYQALQNVLAK